MGERIERCVEQYDGRDHDDCYHDCEGAVRILSFVNALHSVTPSRIPASFDNAYGKEKEYERDRNVVDGGRDVEEAVREIRKPRIDRDPSDNGFDKIGVYVPLCESYREKKRERSDSPHGGDELILRQRRDEQSDRYKARGDKHHSDEAPEHPSEIRFSVNEERRDAEETIKKWALETYREIILTCAKFFSR